MEASDAGMGGAGAGVADGYYGDGGWGEGSESGVGDFGPGGTPGEQHGEGDAPEFDERQVAAANAIVNEFPAAADPEQAEALVGSAQETAAALARETGNPAFLALSNEPAFWHVMAYALAGAQHLDSSRGGQQGGRGGGQARGGKGGQQAAMHEMFGLDRKGRSALPFAPSVL